MPEADINNISNERVGQTLSFPLLAPVALVLFGFLLRLVAVMARESVGVDSVRYLTFAQNYLVKTLYTFGPTGLKEVPDTGYPLLIAIGAKLTGGDFETVARWVSLLAGTITLVLIFLLALRAAGYKPAVYALFIAACCQPLIAYSSLIQTESLFILLLATTAYMSYAATCRGYNTFWFMFCGICAAYAYLTKGIGITFMLVFPVAIWLVSWYDGAFKHLQVQRKFFIGLMLAVVGFVIIALPYQIMLSRVYDTCLLSDQSKWHSPRVLHPEKDFSPDPRYDGTLTDDGSEYLINTPDYFKSEPVGIITWCKAFIGKYLKNQIGIYYYHLRELFSPLILFLIAIGLFGAVWDGQFKKLMLLFGIWSVPFLLLQPLYYTEARYIAPIAVFLLVLAGRGAVVVLLWFQSTFAKYKPEKVELILAIALFLLMAPMMIYPLTHRGPKYSYSDLRDAGVFLRSYINNPVGDELLDFDPITGRNGVLAVSPITGYYAQTEPNLVLPRADIRSIIRFANQRYIDYIVLEERKVRLNRPELREILYADINSPVIPDELNLIYDNDDISGYKVRIFEIGQNMKERNSYFNNSEIPPPFFKKGGE